MSILSLIIFYFVIKFFVNLLRQALHRNPYRPPRGTMSGGSRASRRDEFLTYMLIFAAAVMKADGKMMRSELQCVSNFLRQRFSPQRAADAIDKFKVILQIDFNLQDYCAEFRHIASSDEKYLLIQFLFEIAVADADLSPLELDLIRQIARGIGISPSRYNSLEAMYVAHNQQHTRQQSTRYGSSSGGNSLANDYKILGISPSSTDDEVKKAYRVLAKEMHPDKVNHLGEEMRKAAEAKFVKLNQAYERIKAARGMK